MTDSETPSAWHDVTITSRDGLRLYGRHYKAVSGAVRRPVLCLAGLTRNSRDFEKLAEALSKQGPSSRDVFTFDCRGRGQSEHASNWKDYAVPIEMLDVQDFMASRHLHAAAIIGTSRGGLIAMLLAAVQPSLVGPVVLNDIGPVIGAEGLARISGYVGSTPTPRNWDDAARQLAQANAEHFPAIGREEWMAVAKQMFNDKDGRPSLGYDPNLARTLSVTDGAVPELWPQFMALKRNPCLVVRGSQSDILSAETSAKMVARHPDCREFLVEGQGHAPLLRDQATINEIQKFLAATD